MAVPLRGVMVCRLTGNWVAWEEGTLSDAAGHSAHRYGLMVRGTLSVTADGQFHEGCAMMA